MPRLIAKSTAGFTLVEILIVVVILGVLAMLVIPLFADARGDAEKIAFVTDVRIFTEAAILFEQEQGDYLEDSSSGQVPAGFEDYIQEAKWTDPTPIGGVWDSEFESFGIRSGLGVHFNGGDNPGDEYMTSIDRILDDANLAVGGFRKIADDRYYSIIAAD